MFTDLEVASKMFRATLALHFCKLSSCSRNLGGSAPNCYQDFLVISFQKMPTATDHKIDFTQTFVIIPTHLLSRILKLIKY